MSAHDHLILHVAGQGFAVNVRETQDVFAPTAVTPAPLSPPEVLGVLNLRGKIVTCIDARARLGLPLAEAGAPRMAVGLEQNGEAYALVIDAVDEVLALSDDTFEPTPPNLDPRWAEVSRGVFRLEGRLLVALDVSRMLAPVSAPASLAA